MIPSVGVRGRKFNHYGLLTREMFLPSFVEKFSFVRKFSFGKNFVNIPLTNS